MQKPTVKPKTVPKPEKTVTIVNKPGIKIVHL
jgi:hypothetical protein